jgi:hypothetical protein
MVHHKGNARAGTRFIPEVWQASLSKESEMSEPVYPRTAECVDLRVALLRELNALKLFTDSPNDQTYEVQHAARRNSNNAWHSWLVAGLRAEAEKAQ